MMQASPGPNSATAPESLVMRIRPSMTQKNSSLPGAKAMLQAPGSQAQMPADRSPLAVRKCSQVVRCGFPASSRSGRGRSKTEAGWRAEKTVSLGMSFLQAFIGFLPPACDIGLCGLGEPAAGGVRHVDHGTGDLFIAQVRVA